tara:strand:+ start:1187 stop:1486 length:300 start_codon:yes stop_codon:yes gene_type:complete
MDLDKIVKKIRNSELAEDDVLKYGRILITEYAKEYHKKQLIIHSVVVSKSVIDELNCAHNEYHQIMMKEVKPLSRQYFEAYGRREGVATAIEIITGEEM